MISKKDPMNLFSRSIRLLQLYGNLTIMKRWDSGTFLKESFVCNCLIISCFFQKRLTRIDTWQEKVERGCSSNCQGKPYIWTEDFRVHCCRGKDLCNGVPPTKLPSTFTIILLTLLAITGVKILQWMEETQPPQERDYWTKTGWVWETWMSDWDTWWMERMKCMSENEM